VVARKTILKKKFQIGSHRVGMFYIIVGAPIQSVAMEICTVVKVTNVMKRANFSGSIFRSLISAKGQFFRLSHIKGASMALITVPRITALACDNLVMFSAWCQIVTKDNSQLTRMKEQHFLRPTNVTSSSVT
jgi:hypothetical protein